MAINNLLGINSVTNQLLPLIGLGGWALQTGKYNGCTFVAFVQIPVIQNSQVYQDGVDIVAAYNQLTGSNILGSDPNGTGQLFNTNLMSPQFSSELFCQIVTKMLPFANRCNTEDLGFGGWEFKFTLLFLGDNYQKAIQNLVNAIQNPPSGSDYLTLVHPIKGVIPGVTRVTYFKEDTIYSQWNGGTVNIVFRSEQSYLQESGNVGIVQQITQAITAGLNAVLAINGAVTAFSSLLGNNVTTTSTTAAPQTYTVISNIQKSNVAVSNTLLNSLAYAYQTSATSVTNSTLQSTIIDYSFIPTSLSQNPPFKASTADILLQAYVNAVEAAITLIQKYFPQSSPIGGVVNEMINTLNSSVTSLYNVCTLLIPVTSNITYTVPTDMSIRMVLAYNNIPLSQTTNVLALNPTIPSANLIYAGTVINL